jgi:hypothetical protein
MGGVGGGCKEVVSAQENEYCRFLTEHVDVTLNAEWNYRWDVPRSNLNGQKLHSDWFSVLVER